MWLENCTGKNSTDLAIIIQDTQPLFNKISATMFLM